MTIKQRLQVKPTNIYTVCPILVYRKVCLSLKTDYILSTQKFPKVQKNCFYIQSTYIHDTGTGIQKGLPMGTYAQTTLTPVKSFYYRRHNLKFCGATTINETTLVNAARTNDVTIVTPAPGKNPSNPL